MVGPVLPAASDRDGVSSEREPRRVPLPVAALCGWVALLLPLVVSINAVGGWPDWQTDRAVVRDLGLVPLEWQGGLSTLLAQLAALLPLGGRLLRAEWVSALALALSTRLLYSLIRRALDAAAGFAANPVLALCASVLVSLAPVARFEGARIGGASVALALVLLGAHGLWRPGAQRDARTWVLVGGLAGLTFAQDQAAGVVLALLIVARAWLEPGSAGARAAHSVVGAALFGFLLGALLHAVRRFGLELWAAPDLAQLAGAAENELGPALSRLWPSSAELGPLVALPAALGAALALATRAARRAFAPFLLLVTIELALRGLWSLAAAPPSASTQLLGCAGAAGLFALCVQSGARLAWRVQLPFAKPACALMIAYCATLVLERLDGTREPDAAAAAGAELWTERALGRLPAASVLLVRSDAALLRLWAARALHDERPDVVVMPTALFASGALGRGALPFTPALSPLVRQLAVSGFADEYTATELAERVPLLGELDPHWDQRLLEHLAPAGLWLRVSPHALAPSARSQAAAESRAAFRELVSVAESAERGRDRGLRRALAPMASQQALTLAALGDRSGARALLRTERALDRSEPVALALRQRLAAEPEGKVAVHDLID
jgi:hypothetical protein